jgi:phosphate transport system protein
MLKNFKILLENIQNELYDMGQKVVSSNEISLEAIVSNDKELFSKAKNVLNNIGTVSNKIDNSIVKGLALHQPEAKDLRKMISYLKITNELSRAASNTKNYIKNFSKFIDMEIDSKNILEFSIPLQKSSISAIKTSIDMIKISQRDTIEKYFDKVNVEENKTDDLYGMIEKNLLKVLSHKVELSKDYLYVLSSLRKLEKVAHRASSIANLLIFAEVGGELSS